MKKTITAVLAITIIAFVSHTPVMAKIPASINIQTVGAQYLKALNSSNNGLIESALFECIKLQVYAPGYNCDKLAKAVETVMEKNKSPELRYKAYIVAQFLRHPGWLQNMENTAEIGQISRANNDEEEDQLFVLLADELQNRYLVLAGNTEK